MIPKLFYILVKFRLHPIALVADIEKVFLMIGITEEDRDKLRFLWFENPNLKRLYLDYVLHLQYWVQ